jgi:hypothetical protein
MMKIYHYFLIAKYLHHVHKRFPQLVASPPPHYPACNSIPCIKTKFKCTYINHKGNATRSRANQKIVIVKPSQTILEKSSAT